MAAAGVPVEMTFVKYVGSMEPSELCMLIGTCLDTAAARMGIAQPLKPNSVAALSQMMVLAQALQAVPAAPANDHCETCKVMLATHLWCMADASHNMTALLRPICPCSLFKRL